MSHKTTDTSRLQRMGLAKQTAILLTCTAGLTTLIWARDPINLPAPADPVHMSATSLEISLGQSVLMALTNNRSLRVQCMTPEVQRTFEAEQRAVFDPILAGNAAFERNYSATNQLSRDAEDTVSGSIAASQLFPTGTRLDLLLNSTRDSNDRRPSVYASEAELAITQALLQGRPRAVNLVRLQQARIETTISEYELRGYTEKLVADTERAYWECALARRRVAIVEKSMTLAEQQLHEVEQRIKVGNLPETELAAAQAEVASRKEALINTRSNLAKADLQLLLFIAPHMLAGPRAKLLLLTEPAVPDVDWGPVAAHVAIALQMRPDVNQAFLKIQSGDLELVKTRNGLLPKLDVFITLGDTGYARSFGNSVSEIDGQDLNTSTGVAFEFPIHNRAAKASHQRAQFTREQMAEAFRNLDDLVRVDVETGLIEVHRTREQVTATAITRFLQEEKMRAETVKFNVGRSTALLVAQAQRDLLLSQVAEVDTVVHHLQAVVDLFRIEGSLLERRGVTAPGRQPNR